MLRLSEDVYVTDKQLRVFRDTLQERHDRLLNRDNAEYCCCLSDLLDELDDEIDSRYKMRDNEG